jgi:hypothetical protein
MDQRPDALYNELFIDLAPYLNKPPVEVHGYGPPALVKQFAARHMLDSFTKKFVSHSDAADVRALHTFLASNKKCEGWRNPLDDEATSESDRMLLGQFSKLMEDFFLVDLGADAELSWANICEDARSGPGSAIGARNGSFYAKHFSSQLTASSQSLINIYQAHGWLYPEFHIAESIRAEEFGAPLLVGGSRTCFVPKTADISRMICIEPGINMYLQLGLGSLIEKRLRRFFSIDLARQPSINRWLAKLGSEQPDGDRSFATIDLSSASDSIALGLLGSYVPNEWQSAILELRSCKTSVGGDSVELKMVSTMGNGFTFPLQTAIFSCIAAACVTLDNRSHKAVCLDDLTRDFSVFGDDIVVDKKYCHRVMRLLDLLGFQANAAKTFQSGLFRESCGHDYYNGYNVRPVYLRKMNSDQDIAVLINLLNEWSARTNIRVPRTVGLLWTYFRSKPYIVPFDENMDAGIKVPGSLIEPLFKKRGYDIRRDKNLSISYKRWVARPRKIRIGEGTVHVPKGARRLIYNPPGLLQAYLRGEICNGTISIRANGGIPYGTKSAVTPWWDYQRFTHEEQVFGLALDKTQWIAAVSENIGHLISAQITN